MRNTIALLAVLALLSSPAFAQKKPAAKARPTSAKTPTATTAVSAASLVQGKAIYTQNCLTCHQADGGGVDGLNPPLSKTSWVLGEKSRIINVLLHGLQGQDIDGEPYNNVMPAQDHLSDQQIADVLTFVRNSFGNKASAIKAPEVKALRTGQK